MDFIGEKLVKLFVWIVDPALSRSGLNLNISKFLFGFYAHLDNALSKSRPKLY